jgi:uncharacterized membrane protein required for colicin V production
MLLLEILVIVILIGFAANGFRAGIIEGIGRVVGALIGFWVAKSFAIVPVTVISLFLPLSWAYVISFLIVFAIINHLVGFLFHAADRIFGVLTKLPILKQISEVAGLILGILEGVVVIGGIAYLLRQLAQTGMIQTIVELKTVQAIEKVFTMLLGFFL